MGCVRKRGKSWNAQVRIAGWRSFTKSFKSKSDAKLWIDELERKLHSAPIPDIPIDRKITLGELLIKYADEVSPSHKGCVAETCRLKSIARRWIGELDIRYLTKQHFIQYRDDRMTVVTGSSVGSELALMKRVLDTAVKKWGYGIPYNPIKDIEFPKGSNARTRRLVGDEKERLLIAASSQRNIYITSIGLEDFKRRPKCVLGVLSIRSLPTCWQILSHVSSGLSFITSSPSDSYPS